MNQQLFHRYILVCLLSGLIIGGACAQSKRQAEAAVYQFEASVGSKKAYLWIPPQCRRVRGLIVSFANLLERNWMEDPIVREAAARQGLGVLLIEFSTDGIMPNLGAESKQAFLKLLKHLAKKSGYGEIEYAPFIPIEHSIHSVFCWSLASWLPQRTIAAMPVKGLAFPADVNLAGIPMCYLIGQNDEWPAVKDGKPWSRDYIWPQIRRSATALRAANINNLVGVVTDPGGGHLDWSAKLSEFMALFIDKTCAYRLPQKVPLNAYPQLKQIDAETGWLTDTAGLDADRFQPAPYHRYQGNKTASYWFFDKELALAAMEFAGDRKPRKKQMVSFLQQDTAVALSGKPFITLQFKPDSNGTTFHAKGTFFEKIPPDFLDGNVKLGRATGNVQLRVISGPAVQTAANTFQIIFNRSAIGGDIWLQASHSGNNAYAKAVQPAQIKLPVRLTEGILQTISFPQIVNLHYGKVKQIKLGATSSAGLRVQYFVASGPAIVDGQNLKILPIPPRSKYPVQVTVVAWQWGRINPPQIKSAEIVMQTFSILK